MCIIISFLCALVFLVIYLKSDKKNKYKTFTAFLYFMGASLMWSVDCFVSLYEEGEFFDLSYDDFQLGVCVALLGSILWIGNILYSKRVTA
ncbi:hypothetical protein SAMN04487865_102815 [Succinivibrio dextrinosolvens]|uniref:Uncharacterized protein n=1 Tax=Succinivibrio dextrinosolvens TaxID=83771 RepID=A0A662ZBF5_9GAMM|nr:hypothetical protein SAMN04487865_102815 [Succinivibrio dextrinosolvens]